jgi:branched-chain amino acid transport system ATP-binding protein
MSNRRLRINEVSVEFSGLRALDKVSLTIATGEILGLIGPNGSGKTTLVNAITGQVRPSTGAVCIDDEEITALSPRRIALKGITRSFQQVRLFNDLSVVENVAATSLAKGLSLRAARQTARELLVDFNLSDFGDMAAGALNHGDKRRVEIVRALAGDPSFLLLDEPAAGMNETESDALLATLAELPASRALGILVIDHDMSLIMRLCHRLHVISSGKTIGEGSVETVRSLPAVVEAYLGTSETSP